ncbi:MAG TPA: hypothetical protein VK187_11230, partial [Geobacteraceae bacterium]|nr:hypothetical protein [Geobacteraceae bacterium]
VRSQRVFSDMPGVLVYGPQGMRRGLKVGLNELIRIIAIFGPLGNGIATGSEQMLPGLISCRF